MSVVPVKIKMEKTTENPELEEMAKEIIERNQNFEMSKTNPLTIPATNSVILNVEDNVSEVKNQIDFESICGRFGWEIIGGKYIPHIFRSTEKYCVVRIIETQILNNLIYKIHPNVYGTVAIPSYQVTSSEIHLLNDINFNHCDKMFGQDAFTDADYIVNLQEVQDFYEYLSICYYKLSNNNCKLYDRCGFIRINVKYVVPYINKNSTIYIPLFYFEGETCCFKSSLYVAGWDLQYLKFCMAIQGIRKDTYARMSSLEVINLDLVKMNFPPETLFEPFWPISISALQVTNNLQPQLNTIWTKNNNKITTNNISPQPPIPTNTNGSIASSSMIFKSIGNNNENYSSVGPTQTQTSTVPPPGVFKNITNIVQQRPQLYNNLVESGKPLHQLPLYVPTGTGNAPFKVQFAYISDKYLPCINMRPNVSTEYLITLPDFVSYFFKSIPIMRCKQILDMINVKLYRGNLLQMNALWEAGKCISLNDYLPLINIRDALSCISQINYILQNENRNENQYEKKRLRIA